MNKDELLKKITQKKEFSKLPKKDVEMAFSRYDNDKYLDEEKIKLTRDLLRKVFSGFMSIKLLRLKDKSPEWFLKKHLSTKERLPYYGELYKKVFKNLGKKISVIDLGAGVNGVSYEFFRKLNHNIDYLGIEAVGQLVDLTNNYFMENRLKGKVIHESLFELNEIKKEIINSGRSSAHPKLRSKGEKIVFLFKTIDSLEMLERDYSKKLLLEITPLVEKIVVSFATRSMVRRTKFRAKRNWIIDFIKTNFKILDDFELGGERYLVFCKK